MTARWALAALLWLSACGGRTEEKVIQHVVKAELIERYHVREESIRLGDLEWMGADAATLRADVNAAGRAGSQVEVTCRLKRAGERGGERRWAVSVVEP